MPLNLFIMFLERYCPPELSPYRLEGPEADIDSLLEKHNGDGAVGDCDKSKKQRRFRVKKREEEDEEGDYVNVQVYGRPNNCKRRHCGGLDDAAADGSDSDEELAHDRRERDQLDRNIRLRDAAGSKRLKKKKKAKEICSDRDNVETLRQVSRYKYLEKRVMKKVDMLRDEIVDEQHHSMGVKLSEAERCAMEYKKEVYRLVKRCSKVGYDLGEYMIPEVYDMEGSVNQDKRFAVGLKKYEDAAAVNGRTSFEARELWEDAQIRRANLMFGSKDRRRDSDDHQLVLDDHIDFLEAGMINCDESEIKSLTESLNRSLAIGKLQCDKETLPVFRFREQLLQLVCDHQILIVVGETGSGKTTQIPQYLHEVGYTNRGMIGCTQPRRVAAMIVAARVAKEMGVKLGHEVGYNIRFEKCTSEKTVLKYLTDGVLLRKFFGEPDLASYSIVMLDEAHERTLATDILFGLLKDVARFRPDFKLIISSATLDAEKFSKFFDGAPIFRVPGRRFPVDIYHIRAPAANYVDAVIMTALQIHVNEPTGDILIFLTGQEEIETVEEILRYKTKWLGKKIPQMIICPIYANLPSEVQAKVFEPTPEGARKVVLSTNIAETSVTIDGIKYVIDTGFCKINSSNPRKGMESLLVTPISKAAAQQRAGRSGRTGPGKCYRMYTESDFHQLEENTVPEIQRTDLANVVLTLKTLGIHDLVNFDFMDPPPTESLLKALELLFALGALNKSGELTKLGRRMAEFPLDPKLSKMIVASEKYNCSVEIITIAAMLSAGNSIFYCPKEKRILAEHARMNFYTDNVGDHIGMLNVYNAWKESSYSSQWCYENFVQVKTMKRARDIRDQLEGLMERVEVELKSSVNDHEAIKKAITSGFFTNSARPSYSNCYVTLKNPPTCQNAPQIRFRR